MKVSSNPLRQLVFELLDLRYRFGVMLKVPLLRDRAAQSPVTVQDLGDRLVLRTTVTPNPGQYFEAPGEVVVTIGDQFIGEAPICGGRPVQLGGDTMSLDLEVEVEFAFIPAPRGASPSEERR